MRCKNCNYPLWNLTARRCPECGLGFQPRDFEFDPHSVRFCCPHCDYPYLGTGESGHLDPDAFTCIKCNEPVRFDDVIARPGLGIEERRAQLDVMPWIHRAEQGRIKGWFTTIGRAMAAPQRLIRAVPEDHSAFDAWWFGVLTTFLILLVGTVAPYAVYFGMMFSIGMPMAMPRFQFWATVLGGLVGTVVLAMLIVTLWPVTAHIFLRISGVKHSTVGDAMQAVGYGAGANVISAVPCCGAYFGWIWWVVSATIMLKDRINIGAARATFATILFPVLSLVLVFGAYVAGMAYQMNQWTTGFGGGGVWTETTNVSNTLISYSSNGVSIGPDHALELAISGNLTSWTGTGCPFVHSATSTNASDIPIGDGTYTDFQNMTSSQKLSAVSTILESMPKNIIAHRLGDFVFVHHGIPTGTWDSTLWTVVMVPEPAANTLTRSTTVEVGLSDYSTVSMTYGELLDDLPNQNQVRSTYSLAPLPDPGTVTHASPAVAPAGE